MAKNGLTTAIYQSVLNQISLYLLFSTPSNSEFNHTTNFLSYQIKGRTISIVGSQLVPASSKEILLSKIWLVNSRSLNQPRPLRKNSNRKYQEIINECRYRLPFCHRHLCRNKISKISSKCLLHLRRHQFEHQQFKR